LILKFKDLFFNALRTLLYNVGDEEAWMLLLFGVFPAVFLFSAGVTNVDDDVDVVVAAAAAAAAVVVCGGGGGCLILIVLPFTENLRRGGEVAVAAAAPSPDAADMIYKMYI
jgi:hypothetical protein